MIEESGILRQAAKELELFAVFRDELEIVYKGDIFQVVIDRATLPF